MPLTWNHWWPYEDQEINTETFLADVAVARELGYELAVLDAGWFGGADEASDWWKIRGDWDDENTVRFPDGVAGLAAATRAAGVEFGVWCEIEALGFDARIAAAKPEIVARRDGDPAYVGIREDDKGWLGYVCLGSPAGREHVLDVLDRLIGRTGARWLKVDFNLDPGPGCSRTDHGHEAGDGLYEHYVGLYGVLDELRGRYPQLVVEDCSSGGLRLDLGLLAHVHCGFLSDPDWTEFQLQLLWGISQMLPARRRRCAAAATLRFRRRGRALADAAIQTLTAQHADLDFHHVEPTGVFRCVMKLQTLKDAMRLGRREGFVQRSRTVSGKIVQHHADPGPPRDNGYRPDRACRRQSRARFDAP